MSVKLLCVFFEIITTVLYSRRPKSERSDFGVFRSSLVVKSVRFGNLNEIVFGSFGFRTFHPKSERSIINYNETERSDFRRFG